MTRVELHGARADEYEELHTRMRGKGFTTYIVVAGGAKWALPPAEYHFKGTIDSASVMEKAQEAAQFFQRGVAITEADSITTSGLKPV